MIKDRAAFDLPAYSGLLAGHYCRGKGYERRRPGGTDDWLLILTLSGEGRIGSVVGDRKAGTNQLHLIAPGTTHDYGTSRNSQEWELIWVHFHPHQTWLDLLRWQEAAPGIYSLEPTNPKEVVEAFKEVLRLYSNPGPLRLPFAMNALEKLLLICKSQAPNQGRPLDDRIQTALDRIHAQPSGTHSAASLSDLAGLSISRFSHLFKQEIGMAPRQYVLQKKLQHAMQLLDRTSQSISEVAFAVGMDPAELSQRFKQHFGQSPRAYREHQS